MAALVTLGDVNGEDFLMNHLDISKKIVASFVEHVTALQEIFNTDKKSG